MPQTAFEGDMAYDWEMWIGRTAIVDEAPVTTWTQIFGWTSLPFPDQIPEDIDVTHMQSPGRTRETIPGLLPVADWSQEKQMWPDDDGDELLETLAALTVAGTREEVLVEFNIDPVGTAARRTYRSYVQSYTPTGQVGGVSMCNVAIKILDRQSANTRTIA